MNEAHSGRFIDHYVTKPYRYEPTILRRDPVGADGSVFLLVDQPRGEFPDPPMGEMLLQLCIRGSGRQRADLGAGYFESAFAPNMASLTVPGQATDYVLDGPGAFAVLVLPPEVHRRTIAALTDDASVDFGGLHSDLFQNELLSILFDTLSRRPSLDIADPLFGEAAVTRALAWLLRLSGQKLAASRAALGPKRLARAIEFLNAHLDRSVSLEAVAQAAGASPYHFLRDFKAAFGETPFQYLARRRAEQAARLLQETRLPLADIALACGYASQSHLTTAFRKFVGQTPAAFRRAVQS